MKKMTYESAMARLEEIVSVLESDMLGLEDSLKLFEEATKLTAFCKKYLDDAESTLEIIKEKASEEE